MPDEVAVTSPAQTETDFQAWSKLPEDEKNAQSSAPEPVAKTPVVEAKPAPASEPVITDQDEPEAEVPKGLQKRFRELTTKIRNLEAAAAKPAAAAAAEPVIKEPVKADAAAVAGKPEAKNFETYEEYVEALTDWNIDQREAKRVKADAEKRDQDAQAAHEQAWQTELTAARERYADYDAVALSDMPINRATHDAIVQGGKDGAELAYYLGQHRDEAALIFKLGPVAATLALGRIMASFESESKPDIEVQPAVTRAPRPPKPVAGSHGADGVGREPDPSDYPKWSAWNARKEAAEAA